MKYLTILAAVVFVVVVSHETGAASGTGASSALNVFKKSLSAEEQTLLKKYSSKNNYIQSLLKRNTGVDKRDQIAPVAVHNKRSDSSEDDCCSCNPGSQGCYHPNDVKRSRIIRCCIPVPAAAAVKREENDVSAEEVVAAASPADQELMQKHQSKIHYLVEAAKQPAGEEVTSKRQKVDEKRKETKREDTTEDQDEALQSLADQLDTLKNMVSNLKAQKEKVAHHTNDEEETPSVGGGTDITKRFMSDVNLAKKYGVKLDDLLAAMKRRTVAAEKRGKH